MNQFPIITHLDAERFPLLTSISLPCDIPINQTDLTIIEAMYEMLKGSDDARGLAAVQIGYPKRIFIAEKKLFINPTIIAKTDEKSGKIEGCLSVPGFLFRIKRPKEVVLEYFDQYGGSHKDLFKWSMARIILHEIDHLNGILLTERAEKPR